MLISVLLPLYADIRRAAGELRHVSVMAVLEFGLCSHALSLCHRAWRDVLPCHRPVLSRWSWQSGATVSACVFTHNLTNLQRFSQIKSSCLKPRSFRSLQGFDSFLNRAFVYQFLHWQWQVRELLLPWWFWLSWPSMCAWWIASGGSG